MSTSTPPSFQMPEPQSSLFEIKPYVPGRVSAIGADPKTGHVFKLSSNENPFGPSPRVYDVLRNLSGLAEYPDGSAHELRQALGRKHGLNSDQIICGAGSDELLSLIASAYLGQQDEAIYTEHGFLMYKIAILAAGARPVVAPEKNLQADVDAILRCVTPKTKVVFLANPNNPTGTYLPFDEVKRLRNQLPSHVLLVLDAAYAEYVRRNDYESGLELVSSCENVIMTRTFSKIYGLACLRLGWAFGPAHVIDMLNRIRGPFNVSGIAQRAGIAALEDAEHIEHAASHNDTWVRKVTHACQDLGLVVTPSVGNFILIQFSDEAGRRAEDADAYLSQHGCVLRQVSAYGLPNALRMSIGSEQANEAVLAALKNFLNP